MSTDPNDRNAQGFLRALSQGMDWDMFSPQPERPQKADSKPKTSADLLNYTMMSRLTDSQLNQLLDKLAQTIENSLPRGTVRGKPAFITLIIDDADRLNVISNLPVTEIHKYIPALKEKPKPTKSREILFDEGE